MRCERTTTAPPSCPYDYLAGEEEPESMQGQYNSGLRVCAITLYIYLPSGKVVADKCHMNNSKLLLPTCYE